MKLATRPDQVHWSNSSKNQQLKSANGLTASCWGSRWGWWRSCFPSCCPHATASADVPRVAAAPRLHAGAHPSHPSLPRAPPPRRAAAPAVWLWAPSLHSGAPRHLWRRHCSPWLTHPPRHVSRCLRVITRCCTLCETGNSARSLEDYSHTMLICYRQLTIWSAPNNCKYILTHIWCIILLWFKFKNWKPFVLSKIIKCETAGPY